MKTLAELEALAVKNIQEHEDTIISIDVTVNALELRAMVRVVRAALVCLDTAMQPNLAGLNAALEPFRA